MFIMKDKEDSVGPNDEILKIVEQMEYSYQISISKEKVFIYYT